MVSRALLWLTGILLLVGMTFVFHKRVGAGDLYPKYSTLRTDPQGLKALYQALESTGEWTVQRSFVPLEDWHGTHATVMLVGASPFFWLGNSAQLAQVEEIARAGNHVVVSWNEQERLPKPDKGNDSTRDKGWGVSVVTRKEDSSWPIAFQASGAWTVMREEEGAPVVIERAFGAGKIDLVGTSWLFTNAAMTEDLQASLLLTLINSEPQIVFDESHLGVEQHGTVMGLARHYRLEGFLAGALLISGLFIWRSTSSFPPRRTTEQVRSASGRDALTGLAILLQRNIPTQELIQCCIAERKSSGRPDSPETNRQMQTIAASGNSATHNYRTIQELLRARRVSS